MAAWELERITTRSDIIKHIRPILPIVTMKNVIMESNQVLSGQLGYRGENFADMLESSLAKHTT